MDHTHDPSTGQQFLLSAWLDVCGGSLYSRPADVLEIALFRTRAR